MRRAISSARIVGLLLLAHVGAACAPAGLDSAEQGDAAPASLERAPATTQRLTAVTIDGDRFLVNGRPTYEGRMWTSPAGEQYRIEGLLMNARLVQGVFDDMNPATRGQWAYPDTRRWDPDRNTREFVDAMPAWLEHGMIGFTINLQGGCPYGYCRAQPWDNGAFEPDGSLRPAYMDRLARILDRADELGMIPIVGYFYFGQDDRLQDEAAVVRAVMNATQWILDQGYGNVLVEINNECNVSYDHAILRCDRVHELIELAKGLSSDGRRLYVSTSLGGGSVPPPAVVAASDFVIIHGNGTSPERIREMVREIREMDVYEAKPIVNNEDDRPWRDANFGWTAADNNLLASIENYVGWGFFDFRQADEHGDINQGYQSVPVNWQLSSERKREFFGLLADVTGYPGAPTIDVAWASEPGRGTVRLDLTGMSEGTTVDGVDIVMNDSVVATLTEFPGEFATQLPETEHWIRARLRYRNEKGTDVVVETPYAKNPWWPYGGAQPRN